ncbi:MAG: type II secretion system protein GspE, partial [Acetobacteraceae bacterium]|nr:type II secretion system protein GspE [Acetobacteraceae bacterium]
MSVLAAIPIVTDVPPGGNRAASPAMPTEPASVAALVRRQGLLGPEALSRAELVQEETGERLEAVLTRLGLVSEQALAEAFSAVTGLAILAVTDLPPAPVAATMVSASFLRDARALPIALRPDSITVAMANPLDSFAVTAIGFAAGQPVQRVVARASDLEAAFDRLYATATDRSDDSSGAADEADLERLKDMASDAPVIRAVNRLVAAAVALRAPDIHIEPADDRLKLRYRIDGVLHEQEA